MIPWSTWWENPATVALRKTFRNQHIKKNQFPVTNHISLSHRSFLWQWDVLIPVNAAQCHGFVSGFVSFDLGNISAAAQTAEQRITAHTWYRADPQPQPKHVCQAGERQTYPDNPTWTTLLLLSCTSVCSCPSGTEVVFSSCLMCLQNSTLHPRGWRLQEWWGEKGAVRGERRVHDWPKHWQTAGQLMTLYSDNVIHSNMARVQGSVTGQSQEGLFFTQHTCG